MIGPPGGQTVYELKTISHFAAAHQLRDFHGKCECLHGHNWKVEIYVTGTRLGKDGVLIDFRRIKDATDRVLEGLDHSFLNELDAFKTANPSSENIARHIYEHLARELNDGNVRINRVTVWESETASATFMES